LIGYELRELPSGLIEALSDTDIVGVLPIVSPRRRWGLLTISTAWLGVNFTDEDEEVLQAFADQLALVLDGADLLARAVAVERSLAHSEKLAAIGALAARIAHEIRNPVTAARSLAQQLAHEPASPLNGEHAGLILTELERVERQVATLLRFARREAFHFEPVDLGALVRATLEEFQGRLDAAGIEVEVDARDGISAPVDREKIRQVLINLIENAMDALGDVAEHKRLTVAVAGVNGNAELCVTDSGPGVPADTLPQLFEPFFSLKAKGTGLGLAIAKRTIEAHGGRIEALTTGGGMTFRVSLPISALGTQHPSTALRTGPGLPDD
jgi:signal transduction histidine kinase